MKKQFGSPMDYTNAINDIYPFLVASSYTEIKESAVLSFWLEMTQKQADSGKSTYDERIAALSFLTETWLVYTSYVDERPEVGNEIITLLKKGCRDKYRPLRLVSICLLFKLLEKFSEEKNKAAPTIYKNLIFSLVEDPNDSTTRELYF